jgi:glycosyltransferase involved in cell wall biosynthesis
VTNDVVPQGIAVVVPCRDAAPFIGELLDSLATQSLPPEVVVVVDDGSTDGSADVVRRWAASHSLPVRVLVQPPTGVAAALRQAIADTDQPLVARVDADDVVDPGWLEQLSAALLDQPDAGYAYPAMQMFGQVTGRYYVRPFDAASLVFQGNFVCCGALMRRSAYRSLEGIADLPAWEDWDLWLQFLDHGYEGVFVDADLYRWRRHGTTRNQLTWVRRRQLRGQIWWRHRRLLRRYARSAAPLIWQRWRHPVSQQ